LGEGGFLGGRERHFLDRLPHGGPTGRRVEMTPAGLVVFFSLQIADVVSPTQSGLCTARSCCSSRCSTFSGRDLHLELSWTP